VISTIGKDDYDQFIHSMKKDILGNENVKDFECNQSAKTPKFRLLQTQYEQWKQLTDWSQYDHSTPMTCTSVRHWYHMAKHARKQIKAILFTLIQIRQEEWTNSKTHLIRIGKYGPIARMTNPKRRSGPVAGKFYPTKPGEPVRRAINDIIQKEASIKTHEMWINDPPGARNCHFLDITNDEVGPHGIDVNPDK
jgi:hypothetical protein